MLAPAALCVACSFEARIKATAKQMRAGAQKVNDVTSAFGDVAGIRYTHDLREVAPPPNPGSGAAHQKPYVAPIENSRTV